MKQTIADYHKTIKPTLAKELGENNVMAVPRLEKIVVNCGMGEATDDKKSIGLMAKQVAMITGQKPFVTRAKKAISSFKLRQGDPIGLKVTLRRVNMYDFLTRLVHVALPRVRDFRGIPVNGFDGQGNYTLGLDDQSIFPELDYTMIDKTRGFEVTFVTSATTDDHGRALLTALGLPFEKSKE